MLFSKLAKQGDRYIFHFGPTWGIKNEVQMENVLQGVTPLLQIFEINLMPIFVLLYFSSQRLIKI